MFRLGIVASTEVHKGALWYAQGRPLGDTFEVEDGRAVTTFKVSFIFRLVCTSIFRSR